MARTGVVVNEFGDIALDAALIGHAWEHSVVLAGGCVCCADLGDFVAAVRSLEARAGGALERVVIETSGLADPLPILQALTVSPELAARYVPGGVIATIDALNGEQDLASDHLAVRQVALADRIVLTKPDIAAPGAVDRLQRRLREINPTAPVLVASHGKVSPEQLFSPTVRALPEGAHLHRHGGGPRSHCLTWTSPVRWESFHPALAQLVETHSDTLLRVKGLLHVSGTDQPVVVQGVRGVVHKPVRLAAWPDGDTASRLVFITDGLDAATIRAALA